MDAQFDPKTCSAEDAEQFLAERIRTRLAVTGANPRPGSSTTSDSVGIDMPGVGVMPLAKVSSDCTGREDAGGEVGERSPDLAAGAQHPSNVDLLPGTPVHQMSLSDRMRAAVRVTSNLSEKEAAADGEPAADGGNRPPAEPAYVPDYRAIARELLAALYGMIAHFGMPTKARELSDEVETALMHAEVAKVDEVTL